MYRTHTHYLHSDISHIHKKSLRTSYQAQVDHHKGVQDFVPTFYHRGRARIDLPASYQKFVLFLSLRKTVTEYGFLWPMNYPMAPSDQMQNIW